MPDSAECKPQLPPSRAKTLECLASEKYCGDLPSSLFLNVFCSYSEHCSKKTKIRKGVGESKGGGGGRQNQYKSARLEITYTKFACVIKNDSLCHIRITRVILHQHRAF